MKEILYDWGDANLWLFHAINDVRGGFIDSFMLLGSALGKHTNFPVFLAAAALIALLRVTRAFALDADRGRAQAELWLGMLAVFSLAYVVDGAFISWLKAAFDFPRPPLLLPPDALHVVGERELHQALPSGHATFAITMAASLWPVLDRYGRSAACVYVLWVGLARVSLGAHFPTDVIAGFTVGLAVVMAVRFALVRARRWAAR